VVCLPGGPMQDSKYLGDLGGLSARHQLILLDLRGTGASAIPEDTASYRCDHLVGDVEHCAHTSGWTERPCSGVPLVPALRRSTPPITLGGWTGFS